MTCLEKWRGKYRWNCKSCLQWRVRRTSGGLVEVLRKRQGRQRPQHKIQLCNSCLRIQSVRHRRWVRCKFGRNFQYCGHCLSAKMASEWRYGTRKLDGGRYDKRWPSRHLWPCRNEKTPPWKWRYGKWQYGFWRLWGRLTLDWPDRSAENKQDTNFYTKKRLSPKCGDSLLILFLI